MFFDDVMMMTSVKWHHIYIWSSTSL